MSLPLQNKVHYLLVVDDSVHSYLELCAPYRGYTDLCHHSRLAEKEYHIAGAAMDISAGDRAEGYSGLPIGIPQKD